MPPDTSPTLIDIPGGIAKVAEDRYYSLEHIWVKPLGGHQFVIGVSDKLVKEMGDPAGLQISCKAEDVVARNDAFAHFEGYKLNVDLISPISGTVLQTHNATPTLVQLYPYTLGWLMVMQVSKPGEIEDLFGPRYYAYINSPEHDSPMPNKNT